MRVFLTILAILYAVSPFDILPERFFLGWGWIDDLIVLWLLWRVFYSGGSRPVPGGYRQKPGPRQEKQSSGQGQSDRGHEGQSRPSGSSEDPYAVLGLSPGASPDEIKSAYRRMALKYHSDRVEHLGDEFKALAEKRFRAIQEAYQKIGGRS